MDLHSQQDGAPRVLLGSAVTRLLRIKSIYYELVAVAVLGFAGTGAPLFGNLYFVRTWHLDTAQRGEVYSIIGMASFLGLPLAYVIGDHYFRRAPQRPLAIAGYCIIAYGGLYVTSLYMPRLWMVVTLQVLAGAAVSPLAICIFLTLAATAPPEMRTICFAMFGVFSLVFGGFTGAVLLGAVSDAAGYLHGPTVALTLIGPVCVVGGIMLLLGSRYVRRDITLVIEDVLERHAEGVRRQAGERCPPSRSTTSTSTTGPTRSFSTSISRSAGARWWPCSGRTGRASRPCCAPSPACSTRTVASSASTASIAPTWSPSRSSTGGCPSCSVGR